MEAGLKFRKRGIFFTVDENLSRAAFSITLEMNERLLTGRELVKTKSSPSFFNGGITTAVLQFSLKIEGIIEENRGRNRM